MSLPVRNSQPAAASAATTTTTIPAPAPAPPSAAASTAAAATATSAPSTTTITTATLSAICDSYSAAGIRVVFCGEPGYYKGPGVFFEGFYAGTRLPGPISLPRWTTLILTAALGHTWRHQNASHILPRKALQGEPLASVWGRVQGLVFRG